MFILNFVLRLTTETQGDIYFVSICRPTPQPFYDPKKLAGAIKLTSDGHTIDLGRIDQTNVIVNGLFIFINIGMFKITL